MQSGLVRHTLRQGVTPTCRGGQLRLRIAFLSRCGRLIVPMGGGVHRELRTDRLGVGDVSADGKRTQGLPLDA